MGIDFNLLNLLTLIGGIQGLSLAIFLSMGKTINRRAFHAFLVFLVSLSFFNVLYALNFMEIYKIGFIPLTAFPTPEDYLIGVGLYFYIIRHKKISGERRSFKMEYLLFVPAMIYGALRLYWYVISIKEGSNRLMMEVYNSRFFDVSEIVVSAFNLILIYAAWAFMKRQFPKSEQTPKQSKVWSWLKRLLIVFAIVTMVNFLTFILAIVLQMQDHRIFYYPKLLINSGFIYWIGIVGFTKRHLLFTYLEDLDTHTKKDQELYDSVYDYMLQNATYKDPDLDLQELAKTFNVSPKALSACIHSHDKVNFSEFVNRFRIDKVKELLLSEDNDKYTLLALAKESGFKSKSTFHSVFKKLQGTTPSEYKKRNGK